MDFHAPEVSQASGRAAALFHEKHQIGNGHNSLFYDIV